MNVAVLTAQQKIPLDVTTRDYDQIHISLDLRFDFEKGEVSGTELFTFVPLINNFDTLRLHSIDTRFSAITLGAEALQYWLRDSILSIRMPKPVNSTDTITIAIAFTAAPTAGLFFFTPGPENRSTPFQVWSQGQGEDNQHWYPAYDHPDDRLTTEIYATVPEKFTVISNGELRGKAAAGNGMQRWHWKMDESHVNYLTTLVIGEYEQVTVTHKHYFLDYYLPKPWLPEAETIFGRTPAMLRFFSSYILPYPYKRYAQIPVQDFLYGGMENVTATTLNSRLLHTPAAQPNYSSDDLIAHEFAHQWFGDLLTCNTWEHAWLNEGFATYFNYLFNEHYYGKEYFKAGMYTVFNNYLQALRNENREDTSAAARKKLPRFRGLWHYDGGASVLHMLRAQLGDMVFQKCIQQYAAKFQHCNVVTSDLQSTFEQVSGIDLSEFFDQWVYGYRFPDISSTYEYLPEKNLVTIRISQSDTAKNSGVYHFPLPVRIVSSTGVFDTTLWVGAKEMVCSIQQPQAPRLVILNYNTTVLCRLQEQLPAPADYASIAVEPDITYRLRMLDKLPVNDESVKLFCSMAVADVSEFVRMKAAERICTSKHPVAVNTLVQITRDADARVREFVYRHLPVGFNRLSLETLKDLYATEQKEYVRAAILYAAGKLYPDFTMHDLIRLGDVPSHRNVIRRTVMEIAKERKAVEAMDIAGTWIHYDMSSGDMHQLEESVLDYCEVMADTHPVQVMSIVSAGIKNPYFRTRNAALSLATRKKMKDLLPLIETIAGNDRRKVVRRYLENALVTLKQ